MMHCTGCGQPLTGDDQFCAGCGAAVAPGGAAPTGTGPRWTTGGGPGAQVASAPSGSIDLRRLGLGDMVAGGATALLGIFLFLPWYSITYVDGGGSNPISALGSSAGGFRFLILVDCLVVVGYLVARTLWPTAPRLPLPHWQLLTALTGLNAVLVLAALLARPAGGNIVAAVSVELPASFGLLLAAGALLGAVMRRRQPEAVHAATWSQWRGHVASAGVGQAAAAGAAAPTMGAAATVAGQGVAAGPGCTSCGAAVPAGTRFCVSCGTLIVP